MFLNNINIFNTIYLFIIELNIDKLFNKIDDKTYDNNLVTLLKNENSLNESVVLYNLLKERCNHLITSELKVLLKN